MLVSLFGNHAYKITASPSSREINQITGGSDPLRWLNFENYESEPYINDVLLRIPLYRKFSDNPYIYATIYIYHKQINQSSNILSIIIHKCKLKNFKNYPGNKVAFARVIESRIIHRAKPLTENGALQM